MTGGKTKNLSDANRDEIDSKELLKEAILNAANDNSMIPRSVAGIDCSKDEVNR